MPKKTTEFDVPLNVLLRDDGTLETLRAIAFYRGEGSAYAGPVRDALGAYCRQFLDGLSAGDRKRFDAILENVRVGEGMRRASRSDTSRRKKVRGTIRA